VHEKVIALNESGIGLKGYIAIHTLKRGPAFGGIRIVPYRSVDECLRDALNLSEAMTYKCAINDIPGGGGKAVLMRGEIKNRRAVLLELGSRVDAIGGDFFTGPDSGTTMEDLKIVASRTKYVSLENLVPATAAGLFYSIRAACNFVGMPIKGLRAAVQGLGGVGFEIARSLLNVGAEIVGSDIDARAADRAETLGIDIIAPEDIISEPCDLFCPCALGGVLSPRSVKRLNCRMVVGSANNVLTEKRAADMLLARDIVYVPDFLSNSGGAIVGTKKYLTGKCDSKHETASLYTKTLALLETAQAQGITPLDAAMSLIENKLQN